MTILGICLGGEGSEDRAEGMKEFEMGGGLFSFMIQNPPSLGELKNYIGGGFWGVWINSPNPIYVVIILSIFKIY
jgi:hypothetical protein